MEDNGDEVATGIYIGSLTTAKSITPQYNPHNIGAIVNLSGVMYDTHLPAAYINMNDETVNENTIEEYMQKFSIGVKLITMYRAQGHRVLVHRAAGINRSATLIGFFLLTQGV